MCTKLVKVLVNLYFQQKAMTGKRIAAKFSEKQRGNTNNDQCLTFDPIRYREVPIQYEMQIESQNICQRTSQLYFSEKSVQQEEFCGETQQIFQTSPRLLCRHL